MRAFTDPRPSTGFRALARLLVVAVLIVCGAVASVSPAAAVTVASMAPRSVADTVVKTSLSGFDPGTLISDDLFYDSNAMSASDIQSFLDSKIGTCTNGRCLNVLNVDISSRPARYSTTTGNLVCESIQGGSMRVSELVYRMQVACGISAKVILVTLQKEQGLVTNDGPSDWNLSAAMGQSCPDTAPCDPAYAGVGPQIVAGVTQLKIYKAARFGKQPGVQYIQYNPNADCGGTTINVTNYATAALYSYTPYQPNPASLAAGWGLGDGCSSYGNRNFYNYYTSWFGPASKVGFPIGNVELVAGETGGVRVAGWALDPDSASSIQVHVYVGSVGTPLVANLSRTDVSAIYPASGDKHGFDARVAAPVGVTSNVCIYAINAAGTRGENTLLSCVQVAPRSGAPEGSLDAIAAVEGGLQVDGWAIDPDTLGPIDVHVYVDGVGRKYSANQTRPDLSRHLISHGTNHGFSQRIDVPPGAHRACVYAINTGPGDNVLLGCRDVVVAPLPEKGRTPFGALDAVSATQDSIVASGWAIDPDTAAPIFVHLYVNSVGSAYPADGSRPDVASVFGSYGPSHGYSVAIPATPGQYQVCAYAINSGAGNHALLGCRTVEVKPPPRSKPPFGNLEAVTALDRAVRVAGWAIDPDTSAPVRIHVYVDGVGSASLADQTRNDVGAAFPAAGATHGFDVNIAAETGEHQVCVYALNDADGDNLSMGCRSVTVK